jgi:hypothetical protein
MWSHASRHNDRVCITGRPPASERAMRFICVPLPRALLSPRSVSEASGRTQAELAELAEMTQSALSRIERRGDNPVNALRRYVEALGGELEVVAVLGNKRVTLLGV